MSKGWRRCHAERIDVVRIALEVPSPSTRRFDLTLKRQLYAEMGIPSYWLVDILEPSVLVLELARSGEYEERARLVGR